MILETFDPKFRDFFGQHKNCTERWQRLRALFGVRIIESSSLVIRPFESPWIQLVRSVPDEGDEVVRVTGLLADEAERAAQLSGFREVVGRLGGVSPAPSERAAEVVLEVIQRRNAAP